MREICYTTWTLYDYQEGTPADIEAVAAAEGVALGAGEASRLADATDVNQDGLTSVSYLRKCLARFTCKRVE